jgi:hypothetical protein
VRWRRIIDVIEPGRGRQGQQRGSNGGCEPVAASLAAAAALLTAFGVIEGRST